MENENENRNMTILTVERLNKALGGIVGAYAHDMTDGDVLCAVQYFYAKNVALMAALLCDGEEPSEVDRIVSCFRDMHSDLWGTLEEKIRETIKERDHADTGDDKV